jgi:beta-phosphoglucomutase
VITAVIFDLDGTLVQTESLKAESYADAAVELRPGAVDHETVVRAYDQLIGRPRAEVAQTLLDQFGLADAAAARASAQGVATPLDSFLAIRGRYYEALIRQPELIKRQEFPYATALVRELKRAGYPTALTTVSHAAQACVVLEVLGLLSQFDVIITADTITHLKPDPEIYRTAAGDLGVEPAHCLAIEDSLPGIQAASAAGMRCVASVNDLTRDSVHAAPPDPRVQIVDQPWLLDSTVRAILSTPEGATAWN